MEQNQSLAKRIGEIQDKISVLKRVLADDVGASYNEAVQTNEMIQMYERQVENLRSELMNTELHTVAYTLVNEHAELKYYLVDSEADPTKRMISKDSPFGKKLALAKVGDIVSIGDTAYKICQISETKLAN